MIPSCSVLQVSNKFLKTFHEFHFLNPIKLLSMLLWLRSPWFISLLCFGPYFIAFIFPPISWGALSGFSSHRPESCASYSNPQCWSDPQCHFLDTVAHTVTPLTAWVRLTVGTGLSYLMLLEWHALSLSWDLESTTILFRLTALVLLPPQIPLHPQTPVVGMYLSLFFESWLIFCDLK